MLHIAHRAEPVSIPFLSFLGASKSEWRRKTSEAALMVETNNFPIDWTWCCSQAKLVLKGSNQKPGSFWLFFSSVSKRFCIVLNAFGPRTVPAYFPVEHLQRKVWGSRDLKRFHHKNQNLMGCRSMRIQMAFETVIWTSWLDEL